MRKYVALMDTWPQTGPDSTEHQIRAKSISGDETIQSLVDWAESNRSEWNLRIIPDDTKEAK